MSDDGPTSGDAERIKAGCNPVGVQDGKERLAGGQANFAVQYDMFCNGGRTT